MPFGSVVEAMLPARFLAGYAVYVQSCAHLELVMWHIALHLTEQKQTDLESLGKSLTLRLKTRSILDTVRDNAHRAPIRLLPRLKGLESRLRDGLINRNLAVHGAWFLEGGELRVEHYWQDWTSKDWFHANEPISERTVLEAIKEVDELLVEAIDLKSQLLASIK